MSRRRRALVAAAATLAVAGAVGYSTGAVPDPTHADAFCFNCHVDLLASHAAGAHRDVACIACHMDPGLAGEAAGRWHGFRHLRQGWLADPADPRHPPVVPVSSSACQTCHKDLHDAVEEADWAKLKRPLGGLPKLGLRSNHSGHLSAVPECARCHGPAQRPNSLDPLACAACHATVGHARERTARSRSLIGDPAIPPPLPPRPPPPPPLVLDPDAEAGAGAEPRLRCSDAGIARCGTCHNGRSHGNGTKPPSLPDVTGADDTFTCRRCHPQGRW